TFLDVGCGNGLYAIELARRGAARVTGIDIAENMLRLCRENAARAGLADRCEFIRTDLLEFGSSAHADVSIGIGLFDYITDPLPVLRKMCGVTNDRVIVSFPRLWTWRAPVRKMRLSLRNCDVHFYTRSRVAALIKAAGFARQEIFRVGKLFCVVGYVKSPA
ncbi:MAG TPA: class I SAM-dependent methyltransferase, partial [Bacteroidota bacterium]|nr:class I SAM-dependent methyltransferase [Bacteroidota bacterium]